MRQPRKQRRAAAAIASSAEADAKVGAPVPDANATGSPAGVMAADSRSTAERFAAEAQDLKALRAAVEDAAGVGAGLWFSYLFVLLYLLIAVGSVTHRDLLFESPIKLPFLGVELPLIGFFVLGPLLLLIVHGYVLLHLVLLAGKVGAFHAELGAQISDEAARTRLRRQLPNNIFVQLLAGPREVRTGVIGSMLQLIAYMSLVAGPLVLLVFFQLQFLAYHSGWTWWHRLAVVADLALLWTLWPSVARGSVTWVRWRDFRNPKMLATALLSLVPLLLVFTIATFPGEWLHEKLPSANFVPTKPSAKLVQGRGKSAAAKQTVASKDDKHSVIAFLQSMEWTSLHSLLVAGELDPAGKQVSPWSNRLIVPRVDVVDRAKFDAEAKIAAARETISLRGRRLEGAVFVDAYLRKVDFVGAKLQGAIFSGADLRESKFCEISETRSEGKVEPHWGSCADLTNAKLGAKLTGALLPQSASLDNADLQDAVLNNLGALQWSLNDANLRGAVLINADLQSVSLVNADLRGALLDQADLRGVKLDQADLRGASLTGARLQDASLEDARLDGALLDGAQLQCATLKYATLDGASLDSARLRGADLGHANLRYASLTSTHLQGVDLGRVELVGSFLDGVFVWGADPAAMETVEGNFVREPKLDPLSDADRKDLKCLDPKLAEPDAIASGWLELVRESPPLDTYGTGLADSLQRLGCDVGGAPYVIHGLLRNLELRLQSATPQRLNAIATQFLDEARCPGARGLSDVDKVKLREIRARTPAAPIGATRAQ